jgi:hypothetical protein
VTSTVSAGRVKGDIHHFGSAERGGVQFQDAIKFFAGGGGDREGDGAPPVRDGQLISLNPLGFGAKVIY